MRRRALFGSTVVLAATMTWAEVSTAKRPDLEVVLHIDGGMTDPPAHYFILKVNFSGEIDGGGDLNPGLPPPPRQLSVAAHAELAAILKREGFFALTGFACAPDLGFRSIEAWQGTKKRSVIFCTASKDVPLREAQHVLRVWYGVLSVVAGKRVPVVKADEDILARKP